MSFQLPVLGWDEALAASFQPHISSGLVPARVALEHKHAYVVLAESGEGLAEVVGRLLKRELRAQLPVVGDWVALAIRPGAERAHIHAVLPRRSWFSRRAPGEREEEQVVAANLDTVFLVSGLDADFNPRRLERYLALARGSGAEPVVVLNKSDLLPPDEAKAKAIEIARALDYRGPAFLISGATRAGTTDLTEAVMRFLETAEVPAQGNLALPAVKPVKTPAKRKAKTKTKTKTKSRARAKKKSRARRTARHK